MSKGFDGLIEKVSACGVKKVAVAVAQEIYQGRYNRRLGSR